jgi:hypothetical protein
VRSVAGILLILLTSLSRFNIADPKPGKGGGLC